VAKAFLPPTRYKKRRREPGRPAPLDSTTRLTTGFTGRSHYRKNSIRRNRSTTWWLPSRMLRTRVRVPPTTGLPLAFSWIFSLENQIGILPTDGDALGEGKQAKPAK
jgi:hypothetical protein